MTLIPIDDEEIARARALRIAFTNFWTTTQGTPRQVFDKFVAATPIAEGVTTSREEYDDPAPGYWCDPAETDPARVILFIHGGGYGLGSAQAYCAFCSQIAARARVPVFALEYPLAPEAQLPVALDLAVGALKRLAGEYGSVAVMGDSAGGGLALATVLRAGREGIPVSALVTFSPWTDLSLSGDSARGQAVNDVLLDIAYLRACADAYRGNAPATDPRASPLFDPALKLPPTLVQVGSDEVLRDDSVRLLIAATKAGCDVELEEYQGMHHVFQLNTEQLETARAALDRACSFLARQWTPEQATSPQDTFLVL